MKSPQGLIIAATASNAGKTVTTLGLICALRNIGIPLMAAKCGPDYIDVSWLEWASQQPVANLDLTMGGADGLSRISERIGRQLKNGGLALVEAAMGLYDGDKSGRGSAAELAARLDWPILLLLNAKGMGHSLAALAEGFLSYQAPWMLELGKPRFLGLVCTHTGGPGHVELCGQVLKPVLEKYRIHFFGCLPANDAPQIPARHLGLNQVGECGLSRTSLAEWLKRHLQPESLLDALFPEWKESSIPHPAKKHKRPRKFFSPMHCGKQGSVTVAIARDEAFSFCYTDLPALLKELGARVIFFSPLTDKKLPPCDGIYLPGGYPELYVSQLANNLSMLEAIRRKASLGHPVYGECGGYIYLGQDLRDFNGHNWPMAALLPISFEMTESLQALGYRKASPFGRGFFPHQITNLGGHEFHYARICHQGEKCAPLWLCMDSMGRARQDGFIQNNVMGAWTHLYPEGSRGFWRFWLDLCAAG